MHSHFKYFFASFGLVLALLFGALFSRPDDKLHLVFCDVGQGDAILAIKGETQVLIDGGPSDKVLGCLSNNLPFWDRELELIVLTHPEADHITGLISVIERYNVMQITANSLPSDTGVFGRFRSEVIAKKIPVFSPKYGDKIKIGDMELNFLHPLEKLGDQLVWQKEGEPQVLGLSTYTGNFNDTSIVVQLTYGNFDVLLTGDIGVEEEKMIGPFDGVYPEHSRGAQGKEIEVLKVAHHGSKYSTSTEFLDLVRPELAVISVGANNRYGHPTSEVLERLRDKDIKILRTDLDGEIEVVSDGKRYELRNNK